MHFICLSFNHVFLSYPSSLHHPVNPSIYYHFILLLFALFHSFLLFSFTLLLITFFRHLLSTLFLTVLLFYNSSFFYSNILLFPFAFSLSSTFHIPSLFPPSHPTNSSSLLRFYSSFLPPYLFLPDPHLLSPQSFLRPLLSILLPSILCPPPLHPLSINPTLLLPIHPMSPSSPSSFHQPYLTPSHPSYAPLFSILLRSTLPYSFPSILCPPLLHPPSINPTLLFPIHPMSPSSPSSFHQPYLTHSHPSYVPLLSILLPSTLPYSFPSIPMSPSSPSSFHQPYLTLSHPSYVPLLSILLPSTLPYSFPSILCPPPRHPPSINPTLLLPIHPMSPSSPSSFHLQCLTRTYSSPVPLCLPFLQRLVVVLSHINALLGRSKPENKLGF